MELVISRIEKEHKGGFWGLKDFNLTLGSGILGLLGQNGAGKFTLMRILATVTKPTEGMVTWDGADIAESPNDLRAMLGIGTPGIVPSDEESGRSNFNCPPNFNFNFAQCRQSRRHLWD